MAGTYPELILGKCFKCIFKHTLWGDFVRYIVVFNLHIILIANKI